MAHSLWLALVGCAIALWLSGRPARAQDLPAPALTETVTVTHAAVAINHACAVVQAGATPGGVYCWGENRSGQSGSPVSEPSAWPVQVALLHDATQVATGWDFSCALLTDGSVWCWGANFAGQLGRGADASPDLETYLPAPVVGIQDAIAIDAGAWHVCALLQGGSARCWGGNTAGQVGNGEQNSSAPDPVAVAGLSGIVQISAGYLHSCARLASGALFCWGDNSMGAIGSGSQALSELLPRAVLTLTNATDVEAAALRTCAVQASVPYCWGMSLGPPTFPVRTFSSVPVRLSGLDDVVQVAVGFEHTCFRRIGGAVECSGANSLGQLGRGTYGEPQTLAPVAGVDDAIQLISDASFTCAVRRSGGLACWGQNTSGNLGNGRLTPLRQPEIIPGLVGIVEVAGGDRFSCARSGNGRVYCWGAGNIGIASRGLRAGSHVPVAVPGIAHAIDLDAGDTDACAVLEDGGVACWGAGSTLTPTVLTMPAPATTVTVGIQHMCALLTDGTVACWGDNRQGQAGTGTVGDNVRVPQRVVGLTGVTHLDAQAYTTCAAREGGDVLCWGLLLERLFPQIPGPWPSQYVPTPTRRFTLDGITTLGVQLFHVCAVANGQISCWLISILGVIQGGLQPLYGAPSDVTHLAADVGHACATTTGGAVWCWGNNRSHQVGAETEETIPRPQRVYGVDDVAAVGVGANHSCAVIDGGRVACWGSNELGEAGVNPGWLPEPVAGLDGATVVGRVRDAFGYPITFARLVSGDRWTLPDTQGYYALGGLPPGHPPVLPKEESYTFALEAAGQYPPPPEIRWFVGTPIAPSRQFLAPVLAQ